MNDVARTLYQTASKFQRIFDHVLIRTRFNLSSELSWWSRCKISLHSKFSSFSMHSSLLCQSTYIFVLNDEIRFVSQIGIRIRISLLSFLLPSSIPSPNYISIQSFNRSRFRLMIITRSNLPIARRFHLTITARLTVRIVVPLCFLIIRDWNRLIATRPTLNCYSWFKSTDCR